MMDSLDVPSGQCGSQYFEILELGSPKSTFCVLAHHFELDRTFKLDGLEPSISSLDLLVKFCMHYKLDPSMFTLLVPQRDFCPGSKEIWRIAPPSSNVSYWINSFDPIYNPRRRLGESMVLIVEKRNVHLFVNLTKCLSSKFTHQNRSEKRQPTGRDMLNEAGQQIIVTMPNNAKTVIRVYLNHAINEAIKTVCSIKKLCPSELKPFTPDGSEPLDPDLSFNAYNIKELKLKYCPRSQSPPNISVRSGSYSDVRYLPASTYAKMAVPAQVQYTPSGTIRHARKKHRAPPPPIPVNLPPTNRQIKEPLRLLTASTEETSKNCRTTSSSMVEPTRDETDELQTTNPSQQQPYHFERISLWLDEASDQPPLQLPTQSTLIYEALTTKSLSEVAVQVPLDAKGSDSLEANVTDHRRRSRQFARLPLKSEEVDTPKSDPYSQSAVLPPQELSVNTDARGSSPVSPTHSFSHRSELPTPSPKLASSGFEAFSAKMVDCVESTRHPTSSEKAATLATVVRRRSTNSKTPEITRKTTTSLIAPSKAFSPTLDELKHMLSVLRPTMSQPQRTVSLCPDEKEAEQINVVALVQDGGPKPDESQVEPCAEETTASDLTIVSSNPLCS